VSSTPSHRTHPPAFPTRPSQCDVGVRLHRSQATPSIWSCCPARSGVLHSSRETPSLFRPGSRLRLRPLRPRPWNDLWMKPSLPTPIKPFDRGKVRSKADLDRLAGTGAVSDVDGGRGDVSHPPPGEKTGPPAAWLSSPRLRPRRHRLEYPRTPTHTPNMDRRSRSSRRAS